MAPTRVKLDHKAESTAQVRLQGSKLSDLRKTTN